MPRRVAHAVGLRRADGRPRQLRGHRQPDPGRDRGGPRRQAALQRARPRPRPRRGHQEGLQGRRQAGRGHDPHRHPGGVGGRGGGGRARQQRGVGPRGDRRGRGAGRGQDALAAADPARGARRGLRRPGPAAPVRGGPRRGPWPCRAVRPADDGARRGPAPRVGVASGRGDGVRLRDRLRRAGPARPGRSTCPAIAAHLESIGDSVLVAGDEQLVKVHVHNDRPGCRDRLRPRARAPCRGSRSRTSTARRRTSARRRRGPSSARSPAGAAPGRRWRPTASLAPGRGRGRSRRRRAGTTSRPRGSPLGVVAVAPSDGLAAILIDSAAPFREYGAFRIVRGGQGANPSTGELLEAVQATKADELLILPNNPNVVLAARQVAIDDGPRRPRRAHPQLRRGDRGAVRAGSRTLDAAANAAAMTDAGTGLQTMQVTEAVRDATVSGHKVRKGQTIVLDPDDGLLAVDDDPHRAVLAAFGRLEPGLLAGHGLLRRGRDARRRRGALATHHGGRARPRGRGGRARRAAALPVPDLRRVSERRRTGPARGSRSLRPAGRRRRPRIPIATPRVAGGPVRASRAWPRCAAQRAAHGRGHGRRSPVPPAPPLRRPARAPAPGRPARSRRRHRGLGAGDGARHRGPADVAATGPGHDRAPRGRDRDRAGDLVRPAVHREARSGPGDEILVSGRIKHRTGRRGLRGPGLPARGCVEPAPRRADRARSTGSRAA